MDSDKARCFDTCIKSKLKLPEKEHKCYVDNFPNANWCFLSCRFKPTRSREKCDKCLRYTDCGIPYLNCKNLKDGKKIDEKGKEYKDMQKYLEERHNNVMVPKVAKALKDRIASLDP